MSTRETTVDVEGMTCASCIRHIETALRRLEGIDAVEVALREGKVRVRHDPTKAPVESLIDAIDGAGYEASAST